MLKSIVIDDCVSTSGPLCQNGGTCRDGDGTFYCVCAGSFEGRNCEIDSKFFVFTINKSCNNF